MADPGVAAVRAAFEAFECGRLTDALKRQVVQCSAAAFEAVSEDILDAILKHFGEDGETTPAALAVALADKAARHSSLVHFLQATGAAETIPAESMLRIVEHSERIAAANRLLALRGELRAAEELAGDAGPAASKVLDLAIAGAGAAVAASRALHAATPRPAEESLFTRLSSLEKFHEAACGVLTQFRDAAGPVEQTAALAGVSRALLETRESAAACRRTNGSLVAAACAVVRAAGGRPMARWTAGPHPVMALRSACRLVSAMLTRAMRAVPPAPAAADSLACSLRSLGGALLDDAACAAAAATMPESRRSLWADHASARADCLPALMAHAIGGGGAPYGEPPPLAAMAEMARVHGGHAELLACCEAAGDAESLWRSMRSDTGDEHRPPLRCSVFDAWLRRHQLRRLLCGTPADLHPALLSHLSDRPVLRWIAEASGGRLAAAADTLAGLARGAPAYGPLASLARLAAAGGGGA